VIDAALLAPKPRSLDFIQAAAVPLVALTAWQALFDTAALRAGQSLLIHAAAGGVGSIAVQLACWRGARVNGTASPANADYLHSLGAETVIDHRRVAIESMPTGFDVVLDLAGDDAGLRSIPLFAPGGIVVVVAGRPAPRPPDEQGRRLTGIVVRPDGAQLARLGELIDQAGLRFEVAAVLPLREAAAAHALIEAGHTRGKLVLQVPPD
jgi:NADPH:quinone reductase-like Zn-dependent oxidoreductase